MKRYTTIIFTIVLVSACSKSIVTYEQPETIAIAPVTAGMTKAAVSGTPAGQDLLVWANYASAGTHTLVGDAYLSGAVFSEQESVWTGKDQDYFWPKSGALTLSGCTALPPGNGTIAYSYDDNTISVTNYVQSLEPAKTVDFLWFPQTPPSNLDRKTGNLSVEMKHALTWVTIKVQGFGGSVGWKVQSIKLKGIDDKGCFVCGYDSIDNKHKVSWARTSRSDEDNEFIVYQSPFQEGSTTEYNYFTLSENATDIENTSQGTVLIPQTPVQMKVEYHTTDTPSPSTLRSKTLDLKISDIEADNFWQAGKHYVYTVTFNPYKISFSVVEDNTWKNTPTNVDEYVNEEIIP